MATIGPEVRPPIAEGSLDRHLRKSSANFTHRSSALAFISANNFNLNIRKAMTPPESKNESKIVDQIVALAERFEREARGGSETIDEAASREIRSIQSQLEGVKESLAALQSKHVLENEKFAQLENAAGPSPTAAESSELLDVRKEQEHRRSLEVTMLAQKHEKEVEVLKAESALAVARAKAQGDREVAQVKAESDTAIARETAKEEVTAKTQTSVARYQWSGVALTALGGIITSIVTGLWVSHSKASDSPLPPSVTLPTPNVVPVAAAPPAVEKALPDSAGFETLRDVSIWDLRAWRPLPPGNKNPRYSAANYVNYLHIRRTGPGSDQYIGHYSTKGDAIDLRCLTHKCEVVEVKDVQAPVKHRYEIRVDNIDSNENLLVVEATYWNAFQDPGESVATYADLDASPALELVTFVLGPESRQMHDFSFTTSVDDGKTVMPFKDPSTSYQDDHGRVLYWGIPRPRAGTEYEVHWKW